MFRKIAFFIIVLFSLTSNAQNVKRFKLKNFRVSILEEKIEETSGLQRFKDKLYTINDGGNLAELYEISKKDGTVLSTIKMPFDNFDWEAITADENSLYIVDSGNNYGNRKTLKVFRIPTNGDELDLEHYTEIPFYYPEQESYVSQPHRHNFDAESILYLDGKLHVFTKEWKSNKTTHYTLNIDTNENQPAQKIEEYDLGYLATDASYYNDKLYIVGYSKTARVYLTVFSKDENGLFFQQSGQKYILGGAGKLGQVEGIEVNEEGVFISAEKLKYKWLKEPSSFYFIAWDKFLK